MSLSLLISLMTNGMKSLNTRNNNLKKTNVAKNKSRRLRKTKWERSLISSSKKGKIRLKGNTKRRENMRRNFLRGSQKKKIKRKRNCKKKRARYTTKSWCVMCSWARPRSVRRLRPRSRDCMRYSKSTSSLKRSRKKKRLKCLRSTMRGRSLRRSSLTMSSTKSSSYWRKRRKDSKRTKP